MHQLDWQHSYETWECDKLPFFKEPQEGIVMIFYRRNKRVSFD